MTVFGSKKKSTEKSLRRAKGSRPNATYTPVKYEPSRLKTWGRGLTVVMGVVSLIAMLWVLLVNPTGGAGLASGMSSVGAVQLAALLGLVGLGGIAYPIATHVRDRRLQKVMAKHDEEMAELGLTDEELLEDFIEEQKAEDEARAAEIAARLEADERERAEARRGLVRRQNEGMRQMAERGTTDDMIVVGEAITARRVLGALGTAAFGVLINVLTFKWIFLNPEIDIMWSKREPGVALVFWGVLMAILGVSMIFGPLGSLIHDWLTLRKSESRSQSAVASAEFEKTTLDFGVEADDDIVEEEVETEAATVSNA